MSRQFPIPDLHRRAIQIGLAGIFSFALGTTLAAAERRIDFARDVRPILSDTCFKCHGPDPAERKADLRLDTRAGAFAKAASGEVAIAPGRPDESELLRRVMSAADDEKMPPPKSGKKLSAEQIAVLRTWIEAGAPWDMHWAFVAPERPALPPASTAASSSPAAPSHPIDAFVRAKLGTENLSPSPPADKLTLLRRLSLDLTGLPPAIAECDAFVADQSLGALERAIERLLASPRYGERWGRVWLDAARYADSDGYEKDKPRDVWFYRDWVVAALNRDLGYDQFVIEQIAGDLLPNATQDQRVATGFLRNSMLNEEGGADPEQFRMEALFDRMDAIGKSVLGLTIQCAQCHSHKYDPLTQQDYYRMFAYLNSVDEANIAVYTPPEETRRLETLQKIRALEDALRATCADWPERMAIWERDMGRWPIDWTVIRPEVDDISTGGSKYLSQPDGSLLEQGYAPTKHRVKLTARVDASRIAAFRLELLNDQNLPLDGPGRSPKGLLALTEFQVEAAPADAAEKKTKIRFAKVTANVNPPETPLDAIFDDRSKHRRVTGPIAFAVDQKEDTAWGIDAGPGRRNVPREAVFAAAEPIEYPGGAVLTFYLQQNHGGWNSDDNQNQNLGCFRLSIAAAPDAEADPLSPAARKILAMPIADRSPEQTALLFSEFRLSQPDWQEENDQIELVWRQHPEGAAQLACADRPRMRETHMLERGDFLKPAAAVEPGTPGFLHPLPAGAPPNRLTFARWLVDRQSPTTARAIVNRVWQAYFGVGLVSTSEDFGSQGEAPSHRELLDWLAVELMEHGWSLKWLNRLIVTSDTYQQASRMTPDALVRDPYNRLLARGPRFRVDAETVRDVALAASGLLCDRLGGPSVFPPAPAFLFLPPASYGPKIWPESQGEDRYRRALYTFRYRSAPYPVLQTFDAPNGDFACVRRSRSNTPLQALTTLNEPLFVECARGLAWRTLREGGSSDSERLRYAFRRCLGRAPTDNETRTLLGLLQAQIERFTVDGADALSLATNDPQSPPPLPEGARPADAAAWTVVARVLLNLDETITKE